MDADRNVCMVLSLAYVYSWLTMIKGLTELQRVSFISKVCMIYSILLQLSLMTNALTEVLSKQEERLKEINYGDFISCHGPYMRLNVRQTNDFHFKIRSKIIRAHARAARANNEKHCKIAPLELT